MTTCTQLGIDTLRKNWQRVFDYYLRPRFERAITRAYWKLKPYQRKWWERLL